jgi:tetratricopeptide (TPR) repeat protein
VVHRDLKPQNVMIDPQERALIMDFGIARATSSSTMTRTGALMGTPVYMSPEQAKGTTVDARSDVYTLGIIFYELVTGTVPFKADNVMTMLLMRCQQKPQPPIELEPSIPQTVNDIILKCLGTEPEERYQSAKELFRDLEIYCAGTAFKPSSTVAPRTLSERPARVIPWKRILQVVSCLVALIALASSYYLGTATKRSANSGRKTVSLLVADFDNATSEKIFDGSLEQVIITGMEGASFVNSYSRSNAHSLAAELKPGTTRVDEAIGRSIAIREGINVLLTGLVARHGEGYRVTVNAIDGATGKTIISSDSPTVKKEDVLKATAKLVPALRRAIGDGTPEAQLMANGETFTSASLDALHDYSTAQQEQWNGRYEEAAKLYLQATNEDPSFGRAYAGVAAVSSNLSRVADADKYYKLALAQIDHMTEREKFRTRGGYFLSVRDRKAIAEFSSLVQKFPSDTSGYANLALAYCYARDMAKAVAEGRKAIDLYPKNTLQRNNLALYSLYAGDTVSAAREAHTVLAQNPKFPKAFIVIALSQMLEGKVAEATKTYQDLQAASALGAAMGLTGLADIAMYQGKFSDAASMIEKSTPAGVDRPIDEAAVRKLLIVAESEMARNSTAKAVADVEKAMKASDSDSVLFTSAQILIQAHQTDKAERVATQLATRLSTEPRAYAKLIAGEILLEKKKIPDAIQAFNDAQALTDTWIGHFDLGRAYVEANAYAEAHSELDLCLQRKGESASLFLDEMPTIRYLPPAYYYSGRAAEGLGSKAADSYKAFLAIKDGSQPDKMVDDARKRLAALAK